MRLQYPPLHPETQHQILLAYAIFTRGRPYLKRKEILDQLWAMAAGL